MLVIDTVRVAGPDMLRFGILKGKVSPGHMIGQFWEMLVLVQSLGKVSDHSVKN